MKKTILTLLYACVATLCVQAQGIWHEDLGTPPVGNQTISSGSTTFTILAPDAIQNADLGDIFSGIYHAMQDASIGWCYITGISQSPSGVNMTFHVQANTNPLSGRSIVFGTSYTVVQPSMQNPGGGISFPGGPGSMIVYHRRETFSYDASGNRVSSVISEQ